MTLTLDESWRQHRTMFPGEIFREEPGCATAHGGGEGDAMPHSGTPKEKKAGSGECRLPKSFNALSSPPITRLLQWSIEYHASLPVPHYK